MAPLYPYFISKSQQHFSWMTTLWTVYFYTCCRETEKAGIHAACHYQNRKAETGIESLWVLYSDGWRSEKTVGLYPNRPSYIPFQTFLLYKEKKSVGNGFGIQGKGQSDKELQHSFICWLGILYLCPGKWRAHPRAQWLRCHLDCLQSSWGTKVELPVVSWSQAGSSLWFLEH